MVAPSPSRIAMDHHMLTTRSVTPGDLGLICRHREQMFRDMGRPDEPIEAMIEPFRAWLEKRLSDGTYFGFITEEAGRPVGGIGMFIVEWPPGMAHPTDDRRGYILDVYVEPGHRGRGVAKNLMHEAELSFRRQGVNYVFLHASDAGRPLYESLGFAPTTEMAITLPAWDA